MATWGGLWGEQLWGETGEARSHLVVAGLFGASGGVAAGLGPRRTVSATLLAASGGGGLGRGKPWAIHPVAASLVAASGGQATGLAFWHRIAAALAAQSGGAANNLRMSHKVAAEMVALSGGSGLAPWRHRIAANLFALSGGYATDLDLSHPIVATLVAESGGSGVYVVDVPDQPPVFLLNGGVIPISFNLASNGSAETDIVGWLPVGGATVTRVTDRAWHGLASVRVDCPASGTSGVKVRTRQGLGLAPRSGSVVWGHGRLAVTAPRSITAAVRVRYADGTEVAWPAKAVAVTGNGLNGAWDRVLAWPAELDPGRVLAWAEVEFTVSNPGGTGATFWVDGVQHEYDAWLVGPTAVAA